jgi:hypothetical protein
MMMLAAGMDVAGLLAPSTSLSTWFGLLVAWTPPSTELDRVTRPQSLAFPTGPPPRDDTFTGFVVLTRHYRHSYRHSYSRSYTSYPS